MPGWTSYRGLQVPDDTPTGAAGIALKDNLTQLVDWSPKSNYSTSSDPGASDDVTQDYYPGSMWLNTYTGTLFICLSNGTGAAVWTQLNYFPITSLSDMVVVTDNNGFPTNIGSIGKAELSNLSGSSSNIQTQLDGLSTAVSTAQSKADTADSNATAAGTAAAAAASAAATADANAGAAAAAVSALSSSLAAVATTGAYSSLSGTPTIPSSTNQLTNDSGFIYSSSNLSDLSNLSTARYNLFGGNNPVADGTYTVGIGTTQNGTITIVNGLITAIQQAI